MSLKRSYIELHIAVILLAFTAILGDLITLSASVLIWWRCLIAVIGLAFYMIITKKVKMKWIFQQQKIFILGIIIAIHWLCFFGSVKLANASTALICFATISLFTALIEPVITGRNRMKHEVVFGLIVIPGLILIAGNAEGRLLWGIVLGILAALLVAVIASYEKKWITTTDPEHMTIVQLTGAWVTMCVWLVGEYFITGITNFIPGVTDLIYLLILGLVCTSIAWVLATRAIRNVTAFDQIMVINLEPVYGIIMAFILLDDRKELTTAFYIGASIILLSVIVHPIWQYRYARS